MVAVVAAFQDAGGELVIYNLKLSRIQDLRMAARSVGGQDYARSGSASHPSDGDDRPLVRIRRCSFHRRLIMNSPPTTSVAAFPTPVVAKTLKVPANDGFRLHNVQ